MRKFIRAQATLLHWLGWGNRPLGFYIPYRYAGSVSTPGPDSEVSWLRRQLDGQLPAFMTFLEFIATFRERFATLASADPGNPNRPRFDQDWFPVLDAATAYSMVQWFRPQRIIEVGSGHSTRFMAQAIHDGGMRTHLHSIDPEPRREIDAICTEITRATVEGVPRSRFRELAAGDILFVDCSHIAMPGTDVDYLFTRVFPELAPGVVIHVHDIFLPNGYPREWQWRSYNEQNMLLALLSGGERYETLFPCAFMRRHKDAALNAIGLQRRPGTFEGSYWLRVRDSSAGDWQSMRRQ